MKHQLLPVLLVCLSGSALALPAWINPDESYVKHEMTQKFEKVTRHAYLREGVKPAVGQHIYMGLGYGHDGSHPEWYKGWARMVGEVTYVYPKPKVGVYALYEGQTPKLSQQELAALRAQLPPLPPAFYGVNAKCPCCRTEKQVLRKYGAVHGQRVRGIVQLHCDDAGKLEPQLAGFWQVELICNDGKVNMWVLQDIQPTAAPSNYSGPPNKPCDLEQCQMYQWQWMRNHSAEVLPDSGMTHLDHCTHLSFDADYSDEEDLARTFERDGHAGGRAGQRPGGRYAAAWELAKQMKLPKDIWELGSLPGLEDVDPLTVIMQANAIRWAVRNGMPAVSGLVNINPNMMVVEPELLAIGFKLNQALCDQGDQQACAGLGIF